MCLSRLGQIIYGGLALCTIALICASVFTNGWRHLQSTEHVADLAANPTVSMGLIFCNGAVMGTNSGTASTKNSDASSKPTSTPEELLEVCKEWFENKPFWEKVVVGAMGGALVFAVLAFAWNLVTFCACCCHAHVMKPLPGLAGLTALLLTVTLGVFYVMNQQFIPLMKEKDLTSAGNLHNFVNGLEA